MTLGHASMAMETEFTLYLGLGFLVIGTGFFKPNMTSIISEMYKDIPEEKRWCLYHFLYGCKCRSIFWYDALRIFSRKNRLSYGFGLQEYSCYLGTLQFWFRETLFGRYR